jgi:hypothetical protein
MHTTVVCTEAVVTIKPGALVYSMSRSEMVDEEALRDIFSGSRTYFQAIRCILMVVRHVDGRRTPSTCSLRFPAEMRSLGRDQNHFCKRQRAGGPNCGLAPWLRRQYLSQLWTRMPFALACAIVQTLENNWDGENWTPLFRSNKSSLSTSSPSQGLNLYPI